MMMFMKTRSAVLGLMMLFGGTIAGAADLLAPAAPQPPPVMTSAWTFRFTPYGWLTSLNGNQTVRGRTVKVDASFIDVVDATLRA